MIKKLFAIALFLGAGFLGVLLLMLVIGVIINLTDESTDKNVFVFLVSGIIAFAFLFTAKIFYSNATRIWRLSKPIRRSPVKVTLMGSRGVGKTSLLTAMYQQFSNIPSLDLNFSADLTTSSRLSDCLKELQSQVNKPETGKLQSTVERYEYRFSVGLRGKPFIYDLIFNDFPGEYMNGNIEKTQEVIQFIRDNDIIIIAVDMPAMLEDDGRWHETINHCMRINDFFKHGVINNHKRHVIFVPIKCEKYLQDQQQQRILESIKKGYSGLINQLSYAKDHIAISIVPVQTLGGVVFDSVEVDDCGVPRFFYKQSSTVQGYMPSDTEQPLRHILSFSISLMMDQIDLENRKMSKALKENQIKLKKGIKCSDGFEILQGKNLIL